MEHLQVQYYLEELLGEAQCRLEHPFPSINRIADVVWLPKRIIFEVQCSGITAQEVRQRNCDYKSEGYQVVWLLHNRQFNRQRVSAAEMELRNQPHYFTDMSAGERGSLRSV